MGRPKVTVIVPPELADGYRLAGVRAEPAVTAAAARDVLGRMLAGNDRPSVVGVYPPYVSELGSRWQRRLAERDDVLVVPLPDGRGGDGDPARGGETLRDLLARAVGYEFTFDPEGSSR